MSIQQWHKILFNLGFGIVGLIAQQTDNLPPQYAGLAVIGVAFLNAVLHYFDDQKAAVTPPAGGQGGFITARFAMCSAAIIIVAMLIAVAMGGCVTVPAPESPKQSIVYVGAAAASAVNLADSLLNSHAITREQAETVWAASADLQQAVIAAQALIDIGDTAGAQEKLQTASQALQTVIDFLDAHRS